MIVICGSNERLYSKLLPKQTKNFYVVGYTKQMCEYMQACDVFVTKPGGISTTEASALHKPMLFVNAVAGCELRNKSFFDRMNCAVTVDSNDDLPEAAIKILNDSEKMDALSENMKNELSGNAARNIYRILTENNETTF